MRIVVCGAGVVGASCAYYLSLRGAEVTVVERAGCASAASGKSGGFIARDWCEGTPQAALARLSFALHQELAGSLGADYGFRPVTTLLGVASERRDVREHARVSSPPWLDGDCAVANVLGDTDNTAQLEPALFTRALLDAACRHGTQVRSGTVHEILPDCAVVVDGQALHADAVILAMGPWTDALGRDLRLPAVAGLKGYSVVLAPERPLPAEALFLDYETASGLRHAPEIVSRADGTVYVCGIGDATQPAADPTRTDIDDSACNELARIAGAISSSLRGARILRRQACYRPICADAMPILGACPGRDDVFVASGHNCWGMLNAPGSGLAISELVLDGRARSVDLTSLSPGREMST